MYTLKNRVITCIRHVYFITRSSKCTSRMPHLLRAVVVTLDELIVGNKCARVYIAINKCRKFWIFVIKIVLRYLVSICIYNFIRSLKLFLNLKLVQTKFNRVYDLENSYAVRKLRRFLGETWRNSRILKFWIRRRGGSK